MSSECEKHTSDTRTAAPSITQGSSAHASKIVPPSVAACNAPSVRPAAYGVGRDKTNPTRLAHPDFLARLYEPVTDEVGFRRYAPSPCSEQLGHVVLTEFPNQELAAEKRRVADHDIRLRPRRLGPVRRQNRVPALDRLQRLEYRVARLSESRCASSTESHRSHTDTRASSAAYALISMPRTFAGPTEGNAR